MTRNKVTINGVTYEVEGNNVTMHGGTLYVDGVSVTSGLSGHVHIVWEGDLAQLDADGSVDCQNVHGNVTAGGSVRCEDIAGNITAGGSVNASRYSGSNASESGYGGLGSINAGGSVRIG